MKHRAIFLDIDGTLTEPGTNKPPKSALWAIEQARKEGHFVFLCSGRNYDMLSPLLQYDFDGVIASAGGYMECQGKVIYDCPMTEQQQQTAMDVLKKNGVFRTVECMDGSYTDKEFKDFLKTHAKEGRNSELLRWRKQIEESLNILPMEAYRGQPVYKIVIMSPSSEQLVEPRKLLEKEFEFCIQDENEFGFINGEMINRQFDKGRAVARVCEYLHIPLCDSVAIGDSMNDREMILVAGLSICMENGSGELKKLADDICPSVQEDGICCAFRKHHLIDN
ncbi:MAG: Cof-type HAD-IIB family hydrolase [Lachnospiraceae bacterium]|nr:Cof-type HAD-IIB family hydrolase [Lachnospiraceae bacterium]